MEWNNENKNAVDMVGCDIKIGRLCVFKPIEDEGRALFGHMAGAVVDNFENMSFLYVLTTGDRYYFSRKVIEHRYGIYNSSDAEKYFVKKYGMPHAYTWSELYERALDASCGVEAKDNARSELRRIIAKEKGVDIDACECPENEIDLFLDEIIVLFDDSGNLTYVG